MLISVIPIYSIHVALTIFLSSGAPILLVCMARPEILSRRSEWPAPLRLEPLAEEAVDKLIGDLPAELRTRNVVAAGRSEEQTSELQSHSEYFFPLLPYILK